MGPDELAELYKKGRREFHGLDLSWRYLDGMILAGCSFEDCKLEHSWFNGSILSNTSFKNTNAQKAVFGSTTFDHANFFNADLTGAVLHGSKFNYCNFEGASLEKTDLYETKFNHTNLNYTILDPDAQIPQLTDEQILEEGFELDGDFVIGYRTKYSKYIGYTEYKPGQSYQAPIFSACTNTDCHPGIYLATLDWMKAEYPNSKLVKCKCRKQELLKAQDKFRTRELFILEDVK